MTISDLTKPVLLTLLMLFFPVTHSFAESFPVKIDSSVSISAIPAYSPRFGRSKPLVAIVGENTFTELTDYVIPYGILSEANVADVYALATKEGALQMFPALRLQPQATSSEFDARHPEGADYVIVPAVHHSDDPDLIRWIREQSGKGSTIIGVCDGVRVLANAGLLGDRKAVGHWYSFDRLQSEFPETEWVKDKRYIADEKIVTTTGVTASIPVSIALVEAIAGIEKASSVARGLGIADWGVEHKSDDFKLGAKHVWVGASNWLAFWSKEKIGIPIEQGVDEIALALVADSYSRTYRSKAYSFSDLQETIISKNGLTILADHSEGSGSFSRTVELANDIKTGSVLDAVLADIKALYGAGTAKLVALQLEYSDKL